MGPGSYDRVLELLQRTLDPSASSFLQLLREVAHRVDRDWGRLPWTRGMLVWLNNQPPAVQRRVLKHLTDISAQDAMPDAARGATLLLLAWADNTPDFDDRLLFHLASEAGSAEVKRMVGAYLLATPRTRSNALTDLAAVPELSEMVREQRDVQSSMAVWQALVREVAANPESPNFNVVLLQVESRSELHFDLRNGLLDVFDGMPPKEQGALVRLLLANLENRSELFQLFALDLLQYPPFLETARQQLGYRLERQLRRLEYSSPSARIRSYAATLLTQWEVSATSVIDVAARGCIELVEVVGHPSVTEAVKAAQKWFRELDVMQIESIPHNPRWDPEDYAHAALQLLGPHQTFPVDIRRLCTALGCFLHGTRLPEEIDGLIIQRPGLPGPIILYNSAKSDTRKRFTIAHELGHAVLPGHTGYTVHASVVSEPAEPRRQDSSEREVAAAAERSTRVGSEWETEADRYAAALLMPPKWFGKAVWRTPMTLEGLLNLAAQFGVSVTAAAFQAIRLTHEAVAVVYMVHGVVRFQRMTDDFRETVGPATAILEWIGDAAIASRLRHTKEVGMVRKGTVPASAWLDRPQVAEVHEQSMVTHPDHVLTLLTPVEED